MTNPLTEISGRLLRRSIFYCVLAVGTLCGLTGCAPLQSAGLPGGGGACPGTIEAIDGAAFGLAAAVDAKVKTGLRSTIYLKRAAARLEASVTTACRNIARDLGQDVSGLAAADGSGKPSEAACRAAGLAIANTRATLRADIDVEAQPPSCEADIAAVVDCTANCDAQIDPGSVEVQCQGGELSGGCDAQCRGTCTVEGSVRCEGSCQGTCSGSCSVGFSGRCGGTCNGTCDGKKVNGACAGTCDGACTAKARGSCTGGCSGSCSGGCTSDVNGSCNGTCSGQCSVKMKAPTCSGRVEPPTASVDCEAECKAKATAELVCKPPEVAVQMRASADVAAIDRLRATLDANLPALLSATAGIEDVAEDASAAVRTSLEGLKEAVDVASLGAIHAGACLAGAIRAQARASVSITVSVRASASASASIGG